MERGKKSAEIFCLHFFVKHSLRIFTNIHFLMEKNKNMTGWKTHTQAFTFDRYRLYYMDKGISIGN
jgi:hypothetical protein